LLWEEISLEQNWGSQILFTTNTMKLFKNLSPRKEGISRIRKRGGRRLQILSTRMKVWWTSVKKRKTKPETDAGRFKTNRTEPNEIEAIQSKGLNKCFLAFIGSSKYKDLSFSLKRQLNLFHFKFQQTFDLIRMSMLPCISNVSISFLTQDQKPRA